MPDLSFAIDGVKVVPFTASPLLAFTLRVTNVPADERVHAVVLRCQLQLDVTRRHYSAEEETRLRDLFGESSRWGQTLRSMLWTHANVVVPPFSDTITVDLPVPCSFDFNVGATKYFHGLVDGDVPVSFLFSGSVFYENDAGTLQVMPVPWDREARHRLPVSTWRELIDHYYPNVAWLALRRDAFERLYRYKIDNGIPTWEQALESLIPASEEAVRA